MISLEFLGSCYSIYGHNRHPLIAATGSEQINCKANINFMGLKFELSHRWVEEVLNLLTAKTSSRVPVPGDMLSESRGRLLSIQLVG